jgi:hypothetical protein
MLLELNQDGVYEAVSLEENRRLRNVIADLEEENRQLRFRSEVMLDMVRFYSAHFLLLAHSF